MNRSAYQEDPALLSQMSQQTLNKKSADGGGILAEIRKREYTFDTM